LFILPGTQGFGTQGLRSTRTTFTGRRTPARSVAPHRRHQPEAQLHHHQRREADRLAVNGNFIYWANRTGGTIGRAKLDDTDVDQFFIFTAYNRSTHGGTGALAIDHLPVETSRRHVRATRSDGRTSTAPPSTRTSSSSPRPSHRSG
jgi:hypothetical protein